MGVRLLERNLEELKFGKSFDPRQILDLLAEGRADDVLNLILGKQKTLLSFGGE